MAKYIIEGGNKLKGRVKISGNKNSILPCLVASLLTNEEVTLQNVPKISDVDVFLEILQSLGAKTERTDGSVKVSCAAIKNYKLPENLVTKLRASILFAGPLLARQGKVEFRHPGGDVIGKRSIATHIESFEKLGYVFSRNDRFYKGYKSLKRKCCDKIFLEEASVTATENIILTSVINKGVLKLKNCAEEPHVVDLCNMLVSMGARIEGIGTSQITIRGVEKLSGTDFSVGADYIEFGTYAIAAAITKGEIEIENCSSVDLDPVICILEKMGIKFFPQGDVVKVSTGKLRSISKLPINIWPGFPTDLMSAMIVLATQCWGVSLMHDWMFESRMFFVDKLISMGANITIADPHRVVVYGPSRLYGRSLESPDIRAGMALVLAALVAYGTSEINKVELIERGYEDVVGRLSKLGAHIIKVE